MKIDEVIRAVNKKRYEALKTGPTAKPVIRVYMDYDFWIECMDEIRGGVDPHVYEFHTQGTLGGCDVFPVPSNFRDKRHPPFEVVLVSV